VDVHSKIRKLLSRRDRSDRMFWILALAIVLFLAGDRLASVGIICDGSVVLSRGK
jgi:hypothetical protein